MNHTAALLLLVIASGGVRARPAPAAEASWDFSAPAGYAFDPDRIEITGGAASLRPRIGWIDESWPLRRVVTVENPSEYPCISCQHQTVLDASSFNLSLGGVGGDAVRVASHEHEAWLPHWIEAFDPAGPPALLTFQLPGIEAHGNGSAYLYYGHPSHEPSSSWESTFQSGPPEPPSTSILGASDYDAFPSLEQLRDGELLCSYRAGSGHASADGRIMLGRSADGGATWTTTTAFDAPGIDDRTDLGLTCLSDGTLLLPFYQHSGRTVTGSFVLRSLSGGHAWEDTVAILSGDIAADWRMLATYGCAIERPDGSVLLPAYGARLGDIMTQSALLESSDQGLSWRVRSIITPPGLPFNEASVIDLGENRFLAVVRCEWTAPQLYRMFSADGGYTWSDARLLFDGVSPALGRIGSGLLVLASGDRAGITGIRLSLSTDDGASWPRAVIVDPSDLSDDSGYPTFITRTDGSIYLAHYRNPGGIRATVVPDAFVGWNPNSHNMLDGLEDPALLAKPRLWRLVGAPSMAGRTDDGRRGGHALFLDDLTIDDRPSATRTLYAFGRPRGEASFWIRPRALSGGAEFGLLSGSEVADAATRFWFRLTADGGVAYRTKLGSTPCAAWRDLVPPGSVPLDMWTKLSIRYDAVTNGASLIINGQPRGVLESCHPDGMITHIAFSAGSPFTSGASLLVDDIYTSQFSAAEAPAALGPEEAVFPTDFASIITPTVGLSGVAAIESFTEVAEKDGGEIRYQISNDGGAEWRYWNGGDWVSAAAAAEESNSAEDLAEHVAGLPVGRGLFALRIFLRSEGERPVRLERIDIAGPSLALAAPLPVNLVIGRADPNPAWGSVEVACGLPQATDVVIRVYDASGRLVRSIAAGLMPPGYHRIAWNGHGDDGREVASGVYLYEVETGIGSGSGRVVLLR